MLSEKQEIIAKRLIQPDKIGSYSPNDVVFVLKDISDLIKEQGNEEREQAIQSGIHYSEMLPIEYHPSEEYLNIFYEALEASACKVANAVGVVAGQIMRNRGRNIVLVSLARAGTPIGILIKRFIKFKYFLDLKHYSISIIRGKGIDENAIAWITKNHPELEIQFIDGWTGKGMIKSVLEDACEKFFQQYGVRLNPDLAVLADPAHCVSTCGTREDFLIPSACLNSTISGLVSRTVCREDIIGRNDFHGAKYYSEWKDIDLSNFFLDKITACFPEILFADSTIKKTNEPVSRSGARDVAMIQKDFNISDINLIKPGVGETTRVLLRRVPWKILVNSMDNPNLKHILLLAGDRGVEVEVYDKMTYTCCGLIKSGRKQAAE